ncbi:MAG: hypothetical protein ACI8PT_000129 [Gammaproteobacteria bacterium]|jgi:hypothetical protein
MVKTVRLVLASLLVWCVTLVSAGAQCVRDPLPKTSNPVVIVSDVKSLAAAVARANKENNLTIALDDGVYELKRPLYLRGNEITLRGLSGNRDQVVLRGQGMSGGLSHIFQVMGSGITLADLTAGWVTRHVAQVHADSDADRFHAYNVRFVDAAEQILKGSYRRGGPQADDGLIEWSLFEFTEGYAHQAYTGGIGVLGAKNWTVRNNVFRNIRVRPGVDGQATAIMFRRATEGTRIEGNLITYSDSGIRLGLIDASHGTGTVINNVVHVIRDVGISLEKATGVLVAHNTIWTEQYANAIEYRFPESTENRIVNNLVHGSIQRRDGGEALLSSNVAFARADWFVAAVEGDLRMALGHPSVVDRATPLTDVPLDFECATRPAGHRPDIGAEEFQGFVDPGVGFFNLMTNRVASWIGQLPDKVLYLGASFRTNLRPVVLGFGGFVGLLLGSTAFIWLRARSRRGGKQVSALRDALLSTSVCVVVLAGITLSYLVARHGVREGISIAAEKAVNVVRQSYNAVRAPAAVEPEVGQGSMVYHRAEGFVLDSEGSSDTHREWVGVRGLKGLKIAMQARGFGEAPRVHLNVFDLTSGENITALSHAAVDSQWRTVIYYPELFVFNSDPGRRAVTDSRLSSLVFHLGDKTGRLEVRDIVLYRGDDATPPTAPSELQASVNAEQVQLSWRVGTDDVGVARYVVSREFERGWTKIGETSIPSFVDSASPGGPLAYRVSSLDLNGNLSPWSTSSTVTVDMASRRGTSRPALWYADRIREIHRRGRGWVKRGRVLLYGDSLTDAMNYQTEIAAALRRYAVHALGRGGWRTDAGLKAMTADLERHRPEFCLILFGTNNAKGSQKAIDAAVEDIRKMTELAAERGVIPIVGTIPPRGFKDEHSAPEANFNAALISMSVVAKVPVADIFEAIQRRPDRREVIASDGIHWASTGFEVPARVWANAMDRVRFVLDDNQ